MPEIVSDPRPGLCEITDILLFLLENHHSLSSFIFSLHPTLVATRTDTLHMFWIWRLNFWKSSQICNLCHRYCPRNFWNLQISWRPPLIRQWVGFFVNWTQKFYMDLCKIFRTTYFSITSGFLFPLISIEIKIHHKDRLKLIYHLARQKEHVEQVRNEILKSSSP